MKVSTKGRYALRIMLDIAMNGNDGPVSFRDVSERQRISVKYMEQIGAILVRAGFLKSVRGAQGGYNLIGEPSEYTVGKVLRTTEGQLCPVPCLMAGGDGCQMCNRCLTMPFWKKLNDAILDIIDNTTLQDLIDMNLDNSCEGSEDI